jgi:pimeloyl-ACP methyl ester carboxylesterase
MLKHIATDLLDIAYDEQGDADGWPVVLLHGFPYDIHAYEEVAPRLTSQGARVITPYLRGYGPTRFLAPTTVRSGQQAALAADLLALLDVLQIGQATLGGYDWGGRAACIVAALYPSRARGLVSVNGYNIQNIATALQPADPEKEYRMWYQYYLHGERGRAGLTENRREFCRLLWSLWSPTWRVDEIGIVERHCRARVDVVVDAPGRRPQRRALGSGVRQSRFRRRGRPFLPAPFRTGRRRSPV